MRMGGDRDDGIAASIAIGSVRSRSIDRSVGRSVDGGGGGDVRRRARAVERRPKAGTEFHFGSRPDRAFDFHSIRSRSVVPVVDRARDHGRKDR